MMKTHSSDAGGMGSTAGVESVARGAAEPITHFKTSEVVDLLDLSRRQLQYWAKTRLVEPSARTPGGHHRYDFNDLVALKATKRLIDAGVSVQKIRKSVGALRRLLPQVGRPLSELVLVATGDVVLVFHDETVFEAITGQEWVFPVAAFEREVSDFRLRQEADSRLRQAAHARMRRETHARLRGASLADADAIASGQTAAESTGEAGFGVTGSDEADGSALERPSRPSIRSAKQGRKRWSRTG
jgi:DNA-binding transcriptional MerR regulator